MNKNLLDSESRKALRSVCKIKNNINSYQESVRKNLFFDMVGLDLNKSSATLLEEFDKADLSYRYLHKDENEKLCLEIKKTIESGKLSKSGPQKLEIWERGWGENLSNFVETKDLNSLKPKFVRDGLVKRFRGQFIIPRNTQFESVFFFIIF